MKVTVCIGSSCHIKGSRKVVESLQELIAKENLGTESSSAVLSAWDAVRRESASL